MIHINMSGYVRPTTPADETGDRPMPVDPIPAEAFDVAQEAAVATWHVMATTGHRQAVDAAVRAAAPILLAVGRKQAAAEIREAILAAKPSVREFWGTADAARVYALNDAAKIADRIAEDVPNAG